MLSAPSIANRMATARPMPESPPVMKAFLSVSFPARLVHLVASIFGGKLCAGGLDREICLVAGSLLVGDWYFVACNPQ